MIRDGRVQEYEYSLVEALANKANEEKPSCLVLTGDLTFNGEKDSHLELIKLLNKVNQTTKVLVILNNHDICNIEAKKLITSILNKFLTLKILVKIKSKYICNFQKFPIYFTCICRLYGMS